MKRIERHKENMAMVMISILSSPVNTTHAFPNWSFWGWILSTKFYISFPLRYKQKNHSFFFPLSLFRKDEDYVIINLKKILYLSFSHKYILKIIHFFPVFHFFLRTWSCVWFRLKNQLIYSFFFYARRLNLNFSSLQLKKTQFTKTIIQRCWNN